MRTSCSRADLVRLLNAPATNLLGTCAALLGFEEQPKVQPRPVSVPFRPEKKPDPSPPPSPPPPPSPRGASFLQVVEVMHKGVAEVPVVTLPWQLSNRGDVLAYPAQPPLVPWPRLWRHLRRHLSEQKTTGEVDQNALVSRLSRAETLAKLPKLLRARFVPRPRLLVDRARRQMPFWYDQDVVCAHLARWTAKDGGQPFPLVDGDSIIDRMVAGWPDLPKPDFRGAMVLLLGDLGAYGGERARREWRQAGDWLRKQGATLRALVPCPFWRVDRKLAAMWNAMPWEETERRARMLSVPEREQRAGKLLELVSPALRIELGLLRCARELLPPHETDSGTEVDALFHPAFVGFSSAGLTMDQAHKRQLENKFDELAQNQEGGKVQKDLRSLLSYWHKDLPPEIRLEEMFHLSQRLPEMFDRGEPERLRASLEQFLTAIDSADAHGNVPTGVAVWFRDLVRRIPKELWLGDGLGRALRRAYAAVYKQDAIREAPFLLGSDELQIIHRGKSLAASRWRLWQVGDRLRVLAALASTEKGSPAPFPGVGNARVGSALAEIVAGEPTVLVGRPGQSSVEYSLADDTSTIPLPYEGEPIVLTTDRQELRLEIIDKPEWAKRVGRDAFGLWAEFEYKGVVQRMRWIAPGRFWMGSPDGELERTDRELLHEVELSEGYWLADTACTQELWVAVMGKNPSHFTERAKGENSRPVEQVTWEDCQKFLAQLNQAIPGLDLRLPTEAEWENACRAGTTTPFSFGGNITPAQVNYHGEHPYAGGAKGEHRAKTVPVKSLLANPWGLYEMHGNVDEWCLDEYGPYQPGLAVDPLGVGQGEDVRRRVVRGGSWFFYAGGARSAFRFWYGPGIRNGTLGFRFARGRPVEQDKPGRAEGARGPAEAKRSAADKGPRATGAGGEKKPTWAKRGGRDQFGLWAEFEYKGVLQLMRWIAPGRFWMGSPDTEPQRSSDELLHEVELTEGYWLADTACTQDLWVAVMGKNPSHFTERAKGENPRPVEQVSWDDCQGFLEKLNRAVRGIDLRLPTEAEWENACRAGTTTPFSFGGNITPAQVNYHGEHPYAGGAKGEHRAKTVPVKSLPANPWGLYEMHGNVWEWCHDEYGAYQPGLAADPLGVGQGEDVRRRVVRGGSWGDYAGYARSAYRLRYVPGFRSLTLGFRFARGRLVEQDKPGRAEGARGPAEAERSAADEGPRATGAGVGIETAASKPKGIIKRIFGKKDAS